MTQDNPTLTDEEKKWVKITNENIPFYLQMIELLIQRKLEINRIEFMSCDYEELSDHVWKILKQQILEAIEQYPILKILAERLRLEGLELIKDNQKLKEKEKEWDSVCKVSESFGIVNIFQVFMELGRIGDENQKLKEQFEIIKLGLEETELHWRDEQNKNQKLRAEIESLKKQLDNRTLPSGFKDGGDFRNPV